MFSFKYIVRILYASSVNVGTERDDLGERNEGPFPCKTLQFHIQWSRIEEHSLGSPTCKIISLSLFSAGGLLSGTRTPSQLFFPQSRMSNIRRKFPFVLAIGNEEPAPTLRPVQH